jgi:hypothetical protein
MPPKKFTLYHLTAVLLLSLLLDFNTAFAQEGIRIDEVVPNQASPGQEIRLELHGVGFDNLENLTAVQLSGVELEILDYNRISDQRIEMMVFIPEQTPLGATEIRFIFEQIAIDAYFIVTEPGGPGEPGGFGEPGEPGEPGMIYEIAPLEGRVDSDMELSIRGERLPQLGELGGVTIAKMDVRFWNYRVVSEGSASVMIYLPPELPRGIAGIALFYGNYNYEDRFTVNEAGEVDEPPGDHFTTIFLIFIGVAVVGGAVYVLRIARGRKPPTQEPEEKPDRPQAKIDFKVEVDPGRQSIESAHPPEPLELDLRFEVEIDPGVQSIQTKNTPLIDDDATRLSR